MTTEIFNRVKKESAALGENNDCAVKAVTIATGFSYEKIHAMMKAHGRKDRKGTLNYITRAVLNELGYNVNVINMPMNVHSAITTGCDMRESVRFAKERMRKYPKNYVVKNFTVKQLNKFKAAWSDLKNVLILIDGHIFSYKDGQVHDWTQNQKRRILQVWILEKN